ncbi:MAG: selenide, water dikinase SelD [Bacteroidetes bacterium]|nr:selenide, water dikinase SelD [Bacteroidota bacterium]
MENEIKLTQYSHGAGCGCKIAPSVLDKILHSNVASSVNFPSLLVGNDTRDDAAVFEIGNGECIISTTDFFMPIVDDPYDFGRIASANAISDVYAMGGKPLMAIAILGWPINKLAPEIAAKVIEGSRAICAAAGIPLAGGHSIDCPEPVFGLAVTGMVKVQNLKKNSTAKEGNVLFLTKPLGVGILSTAQKKNILKKEHSHIAKDWMVKLNEIGAVLGGLDYVTALTDVTGFGLLGHLTELCEGANVSAEIDFDKIPVIPEALIYLKENSVPGGTNRNWDSYGHKVDALSEDQKNILADPQTSGGLLIAVAKEKEDEFKVLMNNAGYNLTSFGKLVAKKEKLITIVS